MFHFSLEVPVKITKDPREDAAEEQTNDHHDKFQSSNTANGQGMRSQSIFPPNFSPDLQNIIYYMISQMHYLL